MTLFISYLQKEDFTEYNCTAGNALGADYAIIKLQRKGKKNFVDFIENKLHFEKHVPIGNMNSHFPV